MYIYICQKKQNIETVNYIAKILINNIIKDIANNIFRILANNTDNYNIVTISANNITTRELTI